MSTATISNHENRYAKLIENSQRIRWEIDRDVLRGRSFEFDKKFLPDSLSKVTELASLSEGERRLLSQIQGRTYANIFGLVERFIDAKMLELGRDRALGDQLEVEALVRFSDEELKHQELFRRIERMIADGMPPGYALVAEPNDVARVVLGKSTWSVLALTCHIELFVLAHYRSSIDADPSLSELFKDVFLFHFREESQHAVLDELELRTEDHRLTPEERDAAVDDLIALVGAVDGILQAQAAADARYFAAICGRALGKNESEQVAAGLLRAYRWQYILSGIEGTRFLAILGSLITDAQAKRIFKALAPFGA
jgi:hypothetical protein